MKEELATCASWNYHILICCNEDCDYMELTLSPIPDLWICCKCASWKITDGRFNVKSDGEFSCE